MSENDTNAWRKRVPISITCPSKKVCIVRRPGPELALKAGKIARIFQKQNIDAGSGIDQQLAFLEGLSDEELDRITAFARVLLVNVLTDPPLSLTPKEGQLEPDDLPLGDFWFLFIGGMNGWREAPVQLVEGETTVEAVETFPGGQGSGDSSHPDGEPILQATV